MKLPFDKKAMKQEFIDGWPAWKAAHPDSSELAYASEYMRRHVKSQYYDRARAALDKVLKNKKVQATESANR